MADLFHIIEGAQAVLYSKPGIYRQADLYQRNGVLYARHGAGFVRIYTHGGTSHPSVNCDPANIEMGEDGPSITAHGQTWKVEG